MSFINLDSEEKRRKFDGELGHGPLVFAPRLMNVNAHDKVPSFGSSQSGRLDEENADKFSQKFKKEIRHINEMLDLAEAIHDRKLAGIESYGESQSKRLESVDEHIKELQQYITSSTRFLPDYAIKTFQQLLTTLINRYREVRQRIMPAKKFQFNAKKKKPVVKLDSNLEDMITHTDGLKKEILTEKRLDIMRTSELSLDMNDCFEKYICDVGNRVNKHDITLTNMRNCFIEIRGHPGSIRMKNIVNCVILCGPTTFSIYGEDCHQNIFALACHQLRIHVSTACKIFLHVTSRAIIEECRAIEIGRYNYKYDGLEQDFKDAGLDMNTNNYANIGDFDWLSPDAPSPNWQLTEEQLNWDELRQQFKDKIMGKESP